MPVRLPLIIHERLGRWAGQLRPRVVGWPLRLIESRSTSALRGALSGSACPLAVVDLADRPVAALEELALAATAAPNALILVLDPGDVPGLALLARELGAAHVLEGPVPPPAVVDLLGRWLPLARRRAEADGWTAEPAAEDGQEPWEPRP